ncbi:pentapeptide repeat-containing protein [Prochlorococcus sp. MIT 0916]|uniref:pentapeptide repeat-containing protein n=1 Tax=Prochlorococcus sp. MIT 0916 TaxID=3082521 RepID=UPI0039B58648
MRRLAFIAAASLGLGVAVIVDQPASFAYHLVPKQSEIGPGANLAHAKLNGANLRGEDLSRADLRRADLSRADLRGADLSGANLSYADLKGADLSRANLSGASLSSADLSYAYLKGADLSGANLLRAELSHVTAYDLVGCPRSLPSGRVCEKRGGGFSLLQRKEWEQRR